MRLPVAYEPVKNTPSTRLLEQRRADVAAADHGDEDVLGHARLVQQARDLQAR